MGDSLDRSDSSLPPAEAPVGKWNVNVLRAVIAGTAAPSGEGFFRNLVRQLAIALGTRITFVSELVDGRCDRLRLLAVWTGEEFGETFEYDVKATPCEHVVSGDPAYFPTGVQRLFPDDQWLKDVQAESYMAIPLFGSDAVPVGHLGVVHDEVMDESVPPEQVLRMFAGRATSEIERRLAEHRLARSEHYYRTVAEHAPRPVVAIDAAGAIVDVNGLGRTLFGYERSELVGKPLDVLLPEDRRGSRSERRAEFLRHPPTLPVELEVMGRRKDGALFSVDMAVSHVRVAETDYFIAILSDATERRQAMAALRRSEFRLSVMLSALPDAVFTISHDGTYLDAAPGERRALDLGPPPQQFPGNTVAEILPQQVARRMMQCIDRALRTNDLQRLEYCIEDRNGERRFFEIRLAAAGEDRVVAVVRDTTEEEWLSQSGESDDLEVRVARQMVRRNPYGLSFRELTVLGILKRGESDKEIANELGISTSTVSKHVSHILAKMKSPSRAEASVRAVTEGLI